jgi:hypothetical protein
LVLCRFHLPRESTNNALPAREQLELAVAFNSLGTRGLLSLFSSLGRLLWMLDRPLFVICWHPFIVCSPLDARSLLGFFSAFRRLLGVLRVLFAHAASSFSPLRTSGLPFSSQS